jgi:hypothetical protein
MWKTVFQDGDTSLLPSHEEASRSTEQTLVGVVLLPKPRSSIDPCLIDEGRHELTSPSRRAQYAHYQHEYSWRKRIGRESGCIKRKYPCKQEALTGWRQPKHQRR